MTRKSVLASVVAFGVLSIAAVAYQGQQGQQNIDVEKVKDNFFVLRGGGGNTAVHIGTRGVTVVDTKNPGWGQPILDKIKTLTEKPVTQLINTHTHGDHVSGNVAFPATVDIVVHENTKANMEKLDIFKQNEGRGMPKRTFKDKMTLGAGADRVDLYYFGRGHTNGDAFVVFPELRVMHSGDIFSGKNLPIVDTNNGGSAAEIGPTLAKAHQGIKNVDTIVTGHSTLMTWNDLGEYVEFNKEFLTWALAEMKAGRTAEQAAAAYKVPDRFKGYATPNADRLRGLIQSAYDGAKQ
jgi:glyoxylase-like metal-dependent hydrolase (beta-lactamase superfamily II)